MDWSHPPQASRTQYHALREQVQTLARTQHVRDLANKQVGIDPMPDFPIHAIDGNLSPVMHTIQPVQLLQPTRKFHPDELGIRENKPPSQLSLPAIQSIQQQQMQDILTGMRFLGAGIGRSEDILPFFLGDNVETTIARHCPNVKEWLSHQLQSSAHCTHTMAQTLLWIYSLMHREQMSVHFVHIVDWEDHAHITAFGMPPPNGQFTAFSSLGHVPFILTQQHGIATCELTSPGSPRPIWSSMTPYIPLSTAPTQTAYGLLFLMAQTDSI